MFSTETESYYGLGRRFSNFIVLSMPEKLTIIKLFPDD